MADSAHVILDSSGRSITGRLLIDEEILGETRRDGFQPYRFAPDSSDNLMPDLFVDQ